MQITKSEILELAQVASGQEEADAVISNVRILDVYTETVFDGAIYIKNKRIASIRDRDGLRAKVEFDGQGMFAIPGFIDSHFHIDTTLVTPGALSDAIVPRGTTTVLAEVLDFAYERGLEELKLLLKESNLLPYRIFLASPGKVAPDESTYDVLQWENTIALGELNQEKVSALDIDEIEKIIQARKLDKIISGHVVNIPEEALDLYAILGYQDEHNADTFDEAKSRLRYGMKKIIRCGGHNNSLEEIIKGAVLEKIPSDRMLFASDDIYIDEILNNGHIDRMVRTAISLGMDPIKAIKIGTINAAQHLRLEDSIGSIVPGRFADIVLVDNLRSLIPQFVFKDGQLVAKNGRLLQKVDIDYSELEKPFQAKIQDLTIEVLENATNVMPGFILNIKNDGGIEKESISEDTSYKLDDLINAGILPFYMISRSKDEARVVKKVYIRGFNLKNGAIGTLFTQGGQSVNVLGSNLQDVLLAATEIDSENGALVMVSEREIKGKLVLQYGSMISSEKADKVSNIMNSMSRLIKDQGCELDAPFITLFFLPFYF